MSHAADHRPVSEPAEGIELGPLAELARRSLNGDHPGEIGTMLPPLIDHHVHLMIVGVHALADTAIAGVVDLGAPLELLTEQRSHDGLPHVEFAGTFLTAPGGYPVGRPWAAPGCAREIPVAPRDGRGSLPDPAETAVSEQQAFGASVVKVALNAAAGPVFDRATLDAVVAAAHERGMPVVAHVEGEGMTRLAIEAGVDALAHTPFTERVDDDLVARAVAAEQRWISTLFVTSYGEPAPEREMALDNLRRFHGAGGRVLYGTDLGNGDQPLGVNPAELALLAEAGLGASDVLAAICDPWPLVERDDAVATFVTGPSPTTIDGLADWLASACIVPAEDLEAL
ncbi:amidohydrolase family protein [Agromyces bauzanensis]